MEEEELCAALLCRRPTGMFGVAIIGSPFVLTTGLVTSNTCSRGAMTPTLFWLRNLINPHQLWHNVVYTFMKVKVKKTQK